MKGETVSEQNALAVRPLPNRLFGITHDPSTGAPVVRIPRSVKVSIGIPAGKDTEVYKDTDGSWVIMCNGEGKRKANLEEAQKAYPFIREKAPVKNYPRKLDYITFSHPTHDGFMPAWEMIDAHPPRPTNIEIAFTDEEPLSLGYQMWSTTELKCSGDGMNAMRVLSMAETREEKELAAASQAAGMEHFPIIGGCAVGGCKFYGKMCKPTTMLTMQCVAAPRLGSTAYFHSTSIRTASQVFSCLSTLREMSNSGSIKGVPLTFMLKPFKVSPEDKDGKKRPSTAYSVLIELRAETLTALGSKLQSSVAAYQKSIETTTLQIEAPAEEVVHDGLPVEDETFEEPTPGIIAAEFYPDEDNDANEDYADGRPARTRNAGAGSVEAADAVAEAKLAAMKRKDREPPPDAMLMGHIDPDPKPAEPTEPAISENVLLDLIVLASDKKISESELLQIAVKHGMKPGLKIGAMPASIHKAVLEDLQREVKPRIEEVPAGPKPPRLQFGKRPQ